MPLRRAFVGDSFVSPPTVEEIATLRDFQPLVRLPTTCIA
jgi:hypothetical protein